MPEVRQVMVAIEIDQECGACFGGVMRPTGEALMSNPPQYLHKCSSCDAAERYRVKYPHITHEPADK